MAEAKELNNRIEKIDTKQNQIAIDVGIIKSSMKRLTPLIEAHEKKFNEQRGSFSVIYGIFTILIVPIGILVVRVFY